MPTAKSPGARRTARRAPARVRARSSLSPRGSTDERAVRLREASAWGLDECLINEDWRERGVAVAVFARRAGRRFVAVAYVVDLFCRGLHDVVVVARGDLAAVHGLVERVGVGAMTRADPVLVAKVVREGRAYGEALGFRPHADAAWALAFLDCIDTRGCREVVPCGRFGQAVVVPSPGVELASLVGHLERRVGRSGFLVVAPLEVVPEG